MLTVRSIVIDPQEAAKQPTSMSNALHGVDDCLQHGIVGATALRDRSKNRAPNSASAAARAAIRIGSPVAVDVVDDVVGVPAERVQRVHVVALHRGSTRVLQ